MDARKLAALAAAPRPTNRPNDLMTITEASKLAGIHRQTAYLAIKRGLLDVWYRGVRIKLVSRAQVVDAFGVNV